MSLYQHQKSKIWTMDFIFRGQRVRESTGTSSKSLAAKIEQKRRRDLEAGTAGIRKPEGPKLFSIAAEDFCAAKKRKWSDSTRVSAQGSLKHLLPAFGKKLITDIEADHIGDYQQARETEGAAGRTINIEVGLLRSILRKHGAWARIQPDVEMLAERDDCGHALTPEEESTLLRECGKSRSRLLLPFVTLLLETGARYNTIRMLHWFSIDLAAGQVKIGKDKTKYSSNRIVPLSQRAIETIRFWAALFPDRKPEDFVFPREKYATAGAEGVFGFQSAIVIESDPTQPIGDVKEAWEHARKRAGLENVRIHDLRHSAASRMIANRVPLPMVAEILGWSPGTTVKMAQRYGHFSQEDKRKAVEAISGGRDENFPGVPVISPVPTHEEKGKIQ